MHSRDINHSLRAGAILCSLCLSADLRPALPAAHPRLRPPLPALLLCPSVPHRLSCPTESCRGKKVAPSDGGTFFCEKCQSGTDRPQPRFLLSLTIQDQTGSAWVSAFDREGEVRRAATARHRGCCDEADDAPQNKTAMH